MCYQTLAGPAQLPFDHQALLCCSSGNVMCLGIPAAPTRPDYLPCMKLDSCGAMWGITAHQTVMGGPCMRARQPSIP